MKAKVGRGGGFRGVLEYALGEQKSPEIVGGTMSSSSVRALASEFGVSREQRPDVRKPVWHCSLSAPAGERLEPAQWQALADDYMAEMGLRDHQYLAVRHSDTAHDHIHIIASRIGLDGGIWYGQWEAFRAIQATQALEQRHGLQITPGLEQMQAENHKHNPTQNEIEQHDRTGAAPARQMIQQIIDEALEDGPGTEAFLERLDTAGVGVMPNVATTGRLNGFSFEWQGIWFKGSQLGRSYSAAQLQKRGLGYEPERDGPGLRARAERSRAERDQDRSGAPAGAAPAPGADRDGRDLAERGAQSDPAAAPAREGSADQLAGRGAQVDERGPEESTGRSREDPAGAANSDRGRAADRLADPGGVPADQRHDDAERRSRRDTAWRDLHSRLSDLAAPTHRGSVAGGDSPRHSAAVKAKAAAWRQQHAALGAPAYRVTLTSRVDGRKSFNLGKGRAADGGEQFYSPDKVESLIPYLSRQNALAYDIYITPLDPDHHYLVIDDMHGDALERLRAEGYRPALIQESSTNNQQAVLKVPRDAEGGKAEQSVANELVQQLNRNHGDSEFSGVIHPFRMAGFSNKKPGKKNAFTRLIEAAGGICRRATEALAAIRARRAASAQEKERAERVERIEQADPEAPRTPPMAQAGYLTPEFQREQRRVLGIVRQQGWSADWSRIDYQACVRLLRQGHDREAVREALVAASPDLTQRHRDTADYADRTIRAAVRELADEQAKRARPASRDDPDPLGTDSDHGTAPKRTGPKLG